MIREFDNSENLLIGSELQLAISTDYQSIDYYIWPLLENDEATKNIWSNSNCK
jgi:hypothetical protein